ncbi:NAD(P)/FAD-dependent oxidoreductase [Microbacterium foliorum]|uniref:NAD(P)/FAD-dependent oxidoreductase n=1 Tax=Microbacterium foliorum TaxID=104336 RepID=UPI0009C3AED7|nr:FAD-binding oxidoreductase [Microbacterium foliorum]AQY01843.1 hypothetical protein B2G67_10495 [Microbacterium foliorum]
MNCDYLVIGGGVFGSGLAWELASAGKDVVLLEATKIASGSSGGSGARGVRVDRRDLREMELARRAQQLWPELDDRLGEATGYQQVGGLRLVEQEFVGGVGGRASLSSHAWRHERAGVTARILDRGELLELEPGLSEVVTHALFIPEDGIAPHAQTTNALATAARRAGAVIVEHAPVVRLTWSGDTVTAVHTPDRTYTPRMALIVAANAGTSAILGANRDPVPGWSVIPQATFVRPKRPHSIRHLVNHESRPLSVKAGPDGTVQLSGGMRGRWNAELNQPEVDESKVSAALTHAADVYPELQGADVVFSEAGGPELCSPDGIPVIDAVPGANNVYVASHWTAHGFALFPAVIEAMASWITQGDRPAILAPFAVERFAIPRSLIGSARQGH